MDERTTISEQLREVNDHLRSAYSRFEQLCDADLIESEIYLIKSLQAKQAYLIKQAKLSSGAAGEPNTAAVG